MKYFVLFCVICTIFSISNAALSRGFYSDPRHPGMCYINDDMILAAGESATPTTDCIRYSCDEGSFASIASCGTIVVQGNCKLGDRKEPNAPYPRCCDREIICD